MYRTLLKVKEVSENTIEAVIPKWNEEEIVSLQRDEIGAKVENGMFLTVEVNLKAENKKNLTVKNFEIAPDPKPF